jgi:hypothetical protein
METEPREELSMNAKVNPELAAQLRDAGAGPVQAIFQLRSPKEREAPLTDVETERLSKELLERVAAKVGEPARRSNLLRNLRALIVEASPEFVRSMLQQPEVASATPNRTEESAYIPPKGKRPVD